MEDLKQKEYDDAFEYGGEDNISAPNEPHLACVLLLDTSSSMNGSSIDSLNKTINDFKEQTAMDEIALKRVDIAVIEFNSTVRVVQDFTPLSEFQPINLTAKGLTAMGAGINLAIDKVKERNRLYHSLGTPCYQPWIFMITDGEATDDISIARERVILEDATKNKLKFWAVGVPGANLTQLTSLTKRSLSLDRPAFENIFNWFGSSISIISDSLVSENPQLPDLPYDTHKIPSDW